MGPLRGSGPDEPDSSARVNLSAAALPRGPFASPRPDESEPPHRRAPLALSDGGPITA